MQRTSSLRLLPKHLQSGIAIRWERRILRYQYQVPLDGLPRQHTVERIPMCHPGQPMKTCRLFRRRADQLKAHFSRRMQKIFGRQFLKKKFPQRKLEGYLPHCQRRKTDRTGCIGNGGSRAATQFFRRKDRPQKNVGIQKKAHCASRSSSRMAKSLPSEKLPLPLRIPSGRFPTPAAKSA